MDLTSCPAKDVSQNSADEVNTMPTPLGSLPPKTKNPEDSPDIRSNESFPNLESSEKSNTGINKKKRGRNNTTMPNHQRKSKAQKGLSTQDITDKTNSE